MSQTLPLNCSNQFTLKSHCSSIMSIKKLTLDLLTRCKTKQLRTIFIENLRGFLQKKKKKKWQMWLWQWENFRTFGGSSNSSSSSNALISYAAATVLKVNTFPALGNITRYIWEHCCQKQVTRACISNYSLQNTVRCDCLFMLYFFYAIEWVYSSLHEGGYCENGHLDFERHFPTIFTHQGLMMNCLWRNIFLLLQLFYLQRQWIMVIKLSFSTHPKGCSIDFKKL